MQDFDIEVNRHKKTAVNDQGYTSYLNGKVVMAFRQDMHKLTSYDPRLLVIEFPLVLVFDQCVPDVAI